MTAEPMMPDPAARDHGSARPAAVADENLRERLREFRALMVISLLMTESVSEDQILDLAASSAPGLGPWRIDGFSFTDGQWRGAPGHPPPPAKRRAGEAGRVRQRRRQGGVAPPRVGVGVPAAGRRRAARPPD